MNSERGAVDTSVRSLALVAWTALALSLWFTRSTVAGPRFGFLFWNLFLAWVPWVLALALPRIRHAALFWPVLLGWLAFFPNAPYLLTDLVHLKARAPVPLWFDALLLSTFAWTGCLLGWDSLARVHGALGTRIGSTRAAHAVLLSVFLCGVGVFLGRFERLNSWELVTDPLQVFATASTSLRTPRAALFSLAFALFVGAGYLFTRPVSRDAPRAAR